MIWASMMIPWASLQYVGPLARKLVSNLGQKRRPFTDSVCIGVIGEACNPE